MERLLGVRVAVQGRRRAPELLLDEDVGPPSRLGVCLGRVRRPDGGHAPARTRSEERHVSSSGFAVGLARRWQQPRRPVNRDRAGPFPARPRPPVQDGERQAHEVLGHTGDCEERAEHEPEGRAEASRAHAALGSHRRRSALTPSGTPPRAAGSAPRKPTSCAPMRRAAARPPRATAGSDPAISRTWPASTTHHPTDAARVLGSPGPRRSASSPRVRNRTTTMTSRLQARKNSTPWSAVRPAPKTGCRSGVSAYRTPLTTTSAYTRACARAACSTTVSHLAPSLRQGAGRPPLPLTC